MGQDYEEDLDYERFLKAGGGGGGKGKSTSTLGASAGTGEAGGSETDDIYAVPEDEVKEEPENYTLLYRAWFFYGVLWFTFAALADCFNVINGRDLCARKSVCYIGGFLSVVWYLSGALLRYSRGGRVVAGEFIHSYSIEDYQRDADLYLIDSGEFLVWFILAMPFYVMFAAFALLVGNYVKDEIRHKEKLAERRAKHEHRRANRMRASPTPSGKQIQTLNMFADN